MIARHHRRFGFFLVALALMGQLVGPAALRPTSALAAPPEGFASSQIRAIWQRDDGPVASGQTSRPWMWGPGPFYTNYEPYIDGPQGNHLVQYFDKGRLEINDLNGDKLSPWFVTSGLLVKEMVSGNIYVGNEQYYELGPARVAVAGDGGPDSGPTYAHFAPLTGRAPNREGQPLPGTSYLRVNGDQAEVVGGMNFPEQLMLARYEQAAGHNWADVFWRYANSGQFDWLYTLGYPITEPYWIITTIAGQRAPVLVQLFERRVLTYNPANPSATRVEMGNVGRHYYQWRYASQRPADLQSVYDARITVGRAPERATQVSETVSFTNNTRQTLDRMVLRASWRNWDGVFNLGSAGVGGIEAQTRWLEGINLEVKLPKSLAPGERVSARLDFTVKPRPVGGRNGYDRANDILSLGDMLPTFALWENGGWAYYPYSEQGDLGYYNSSDYNVEIDSTGGEALVVGGTGQAVTTNRGYTSWRFTAGNVRDVAYVISPNFINPLTDSSMAQQQGNIKLLAYFLPQYKAQGQRQLQLVAGAAAWFGKNIGPYPFDTLVIGEMGVPLLAEDNYAQEYPMAYFVPASWMRLPTNPGTWEWYTPFHEVCHQWFYSTVGNNQISDPWLDEAMATYMTSEYIRADFPGQYNASWSSMTANATGIRPVSSGVFSGFSSINQYTATVYDTGAVMLGKIRRAMGDNAFYAAIQDYYAANRFKMVQPSDLLGALQKRSPVDLKAIFSEYLG